MDYLTKHIETLVDIESAENFKTKNEIRFQIEVAIRFMKYFQQDDLTNEYIVTEELEAISSRPMFDVLLHFFVIIRNTKDKPIKVLIDERRSKLFLNLLQTASFNKLTNYSKKSEYLDSFSTMIVNDSADLDSASDVLSWAFNENSSRWKIRKLFVQESIIERFIELVQAKLRPFNEIYLQDSKFVEQMEEASRKANKMGLKIISNETDTNAIKPLIVIGPNRKYFDDIKNRVLPAIIVMNPFRTLKEVITLFNVIPSPSVTVWSENISVNYELMDKLKTMMIWINCHKKFVPCYSFYLKYASRAGKFDKNFTEVKCDKNLHYQYFDDKRVITQFGVSFGN